MQLQPSCTRPSLRLLSVAAAFAATLALGASAAQAQALELPQPSPKARVDQRVGVTDFQLDYSSPAVKGRKIWGALVPFDALWRAGANAPTKLTVSKDFSFGGKPVKAGAYSLLAIPGKATWTVILSSNAGGTNGYAEKDDAARITIKPTAIPLRERLAYFFTATTDDAVFLDLEWEKLRVRVPIKVDTSAHVKANIEKATGDAWRPHWASARYLLDSGGDLDQALALVDKSIAIQATWANHWVRAQVLGKKGKKAEAIAAGNEVLNLGKGDKVFEDFFKADVSKAVDGWKK